MGCANSAGAVPFGTPTDPKKSGRRFDSFSTYEENDSNSEADPTFHSEYILGSRIGRGAFAQVHRVTSVKGKEPTKLAVKITDMREEKGANGNTRINVKRQQTTEKEVRLLKLMESCPFVIRVYESFWDQMFSYIVMEKCDQTLPSYLESLEEVTEATLKLFTYDMFQGIKAVHDAAIVHRDIKPDNFLASGHGKSATIKLCDFGLAMPMDERGTPLRGVFGTPPFMSPEMLSAGGYGYKTDVWSMGVIIYVMMLGDFPYRPSQHTSKAMKACILAGVPAPSFEPCEGMDTRHLVLSPSAKCLLQTLLNREPETRPSAEQALNMPWFEGCNDTGSSMSHRLSDGSSQSVSLRPMIRAAKRAGAFDTRDPMSTQGTRNVDVHLRDMQLKAHGQGLGKNVTVTLSDSAGKAWHHGAMRKCPTGSPAHTVSTETGSHISHLVSSRSNVSFGI